MPMTHRIIITNNRINDALTWEHKSKGRSKMNGILRTIQWSALVIGMTVLLVAASLIAHSPAPV